MFRTIFTTLRALLKSGLCATQLYPRSDASSYGHCVRPPSPPLCQTGKRISSSTSIFIAFSSPQLGGGGLRDLIQRRPYVARGRSALETCFFTFFKPTTPDNSEQLKAIWGCRGQVGRLMAFHFSCPTFKQGNNIKVSWFYHEVCFFSIFALFELLLAGLGSRISWVIYYQNDGLMCARE